MGDLVPNTVLALESFTTSLEGLDKFINKAALFSSSYGGALQLLMHKKLPIRKSLTHLRNKIIKKGVDAYKYFHKDIVGLKDLSKYTEAKAYVKAHYLAF